MITKLFYTIFQICMLALLWVPMKIADIVENNGLDTNHEYNINIIKNKI